MTDARLQELIGEAARTRNGERKAMESLLTAQKIHADANIAAVNARHALDTHLTEIIGDYFGPAKAIEP